RSAYASIPTGLPLSPLFGQLPFTQAMPRFDLLARIPNPMTAFSPVPMEQANTTLQLLDPRLPGVIQGERGPVEGRPPGAIWAHQRWNQFLPQIGFNVTQEGAKTNTAYDPGVPAHLNSDIPAGQTFNVQFHPKFPVQNVDSVWTFNGTVPPKLALMRYGEPVLLRHHNRLPFDIKQNGPNAFGRHTISTHEHNGHHGAENDGFTGAYFWPGQFYDYHWPWVLAGHFSFNTAATDIKASTPNGSGGLTKIPGDWRETMSTHWFHDHMFEHTAENVYKGNAAMSNLYSGLDRGNEEINDGVNLRLPSGRAKDWGNLDYDVNLMLADKAWDAQGQLDFDLADRDGFLGDRVTVNLAWKPYFIVERRKYRFRILNGSVARFYKLALSDGTSFWQIGNDGNLLPNRVPLSQTDQLGVAERYDIVIDFAQPQWPLNTSVWLVNLAEHQDGRLVANDLSLSDALSGNSSDPGVGRILEFKILRAPSYPDNSQVPQVLIPNPDLSNVKNVRVRNFEFGRGADQTINDPQTASEGEWGVRVSTGSDTGAMLAAAYSRISAQPSFGRGATREVWNLKNGGGGWDHPVHIHFEEGQILKRDGSAANVPAWERGRKDVYRLRPGGEVQITMQFRDWQGMFMQHCHNTTHEDHAMLMRWEINDGGAPFLRPLPTPISRPQGYVFRAPDEILRDD
ncbi:MAG TPA: multicopper oxidase domain-containing protein, partial [Burkholderiales bacterium]|nr:multicopper oxidase domain-containing protein [Burkholderiales bacterium]